MRQFGAYRSLESDGTKLVECRGLCQKVGRPFFYLKLKLEQLSNHTYSHNSKKNERPEFHKVQDFWL